MGSNMTAQARVMRGPTSVEGDGLVMVRAREIGAPKELQRRKIIEQCFGWPRIRFVRFGDPLASTYPSEVEGWADSPAGQCSWLTSGHQH